MLANRAIARYALFVGASFALGCSAAPERGHGHDCEHDAGALDDARTAADARQVAPDAHQWPDVHFDYDAKLTPQADGPDACTTGDVRPCADGGRQVCVDGVIDLWSTCQ